ncbi:MAG TPA: hypothetical protein PLN78_09340 [Pseudomonadales bacterium]|nr:hypothetical protein [Pseudomonadales bacterium]
MSWRSMSGRRDHLARWQETSHSERFNRVEWLLLGVSALAFTAAFVMFIGVVI